MILCCDRGRSLVHSMGPYYGCFLCAALIFAAESAGVPPTGSSEFRNEEVKMVDFVIPIEVTVPVLKGYTPKRFIFVNAPTVKLEEWIEILARTLLDDSQSKGVDARVVVYLVDATRMTIQKQGEFYSRDHDLEKQYVMNGLKHVRVKHPQGHSKNRKLLTTKLNQTVELDKPYDRKRVPNVFVWHVPCDAKPFRYRQLGEWRRNHPDMDVLVALSDYWDTMSGTRVIIAHPLTGPFSFAWDYKGNKKIEQQPLVDEVWKMVNTCRTLGRYSPCYYNVSGICGMDQEFVPQPINQTFAKYCLSGTERVSCGKRWCEQWCVNNSVQEPCSVTCDVGETVRRPVNMTDRYIKNCPTGKVNCTVVPCNGGKVTTGRPPPAVHGTAKETNTGGVFLLPWHIVLITISVLAVMTAAIGVTVFAVRKRRRRHRTEGHRPSPRRDHRSPKDLGRFDRRSPKDIDRTDHRYARRPDTRPRAIDYGHRPKVHA